MFSMLLYVLLLLFGIVAAEERDKFCTAPKLPLPLPACTRQCLIGENKVLDGNCANNLSGFCDLSDAVPLHFKKFGPCLLNACPSATDRQDYVNLFMSACKDTGEFEDTKFEDDEFNYKDLLTGTPSRGIVTSTEYSTSNSVTTSTFTTTIKVFTTTISASSTSPSRSTSSSSPETEKLSYTPSPPPETSTPAVAPSSTGEGDPTSVVAAPTPNNTGPANDITVHSHVHATIPVLAPSNSTKTHASEPVLSTTAIAGTAAGGTVAIALIISLIFLFLRRRKRRASLASPADMWEPSRNTSPKPKLPTIDPDSSFARYSEVGAGAPMRQHPKSEPHGDDIPRPHTAHNGYPNPPEMRGGSGGESTRYYHNSKRPEAHRHGSNMDSRYPEIGSHAVTNMPSLTSPVSASSTMQDWHTNSPSGVPSMRMSSADLRSEGMRSPVSELGTNAPLRSTRSAELHGAEITSPVSEFAADPLHSGHAAELHNDPVLPQKLGSWDRGNMTAVIAEMEGSNMQKGHRHGVSRNF